MERVLPSGQRAKIMPVWRDVYPSAVMCVLSLPLQVRIKRKITSRTEVEEEDLT